MQVWAVTAAFVQMHSDAALCAARGMSAWVCTPLRGCVRPYNTAHTMTTSSLGYGHINLCRSQAPDDDHTRKRGKGQAPPACRGMQAYVLGGIVPRVRFRE